MLTCDFCKVEFPTLNLYNKQQLCHADIPDRIFVSFHSQCNKKFAKYVHCRTHTYRMNSNSDIKEYNCEQLNCNFRCTKNIF